MEKPRLDLSLLINNNKIQPADVWELLLTDFVSVDSWSAFHRLYFLCSLKSTSLLRIRHKRNILSTLNGNSERRTWCLCRTFGTSSNFKSLNSFLFLWLEVIATDGQIKSTITLKKITDFSGFDTLLETSGIMWIHNSAKYRTMVWWFLDVLIWKCFILYFKAIWRNYIRSHKCLKKLKLQRILLIFL